ncbi:hypothetical protein HOY80DRAFT_1058002 [Tuber brumale]|nr:hypothetical protein HOY80DRAFT_1058002 [Tuber brumale]
MVLKSLLAPIVLPAAFAPPAASGNPFRGKNFWANSKYAGKFEGAIKSFCPEGSRVSAAGVKAVQRTGTLACATSFADVHQRQKSLRKSQIVELVVHNLPERDCSAKAFGGGLRVGVYISI